MTTFPSSGLRRPSQTFALWFALHTRASVSLQARRALREREEALLTCHALSDELDSKQGEIAGLEQEGSKARS